MTICSAWYVVPLFTASRSVRDCISGYCFSKVMFCGNMYWNWKLRPKVRNLFGRSTGIPIPTMNWRELRRMFRKRGRARNHMCSFYKIVGKQTFHVYPKGSLILQYNSPLADQGISLLLLKTYFHYRVNKSEDWNLPSHLISLRLIFKKFCYFQDDFSKPCFLQ